MNIRIGQTIADLRRQRGITQEALAEAIGISAPAVSKWERGQSYPDITLLPPLARYFGITIDTLVAYRQGLTEEGRESLSEQAAMTFAEAGWAEGLAHCEAFLREYPDDARLRLLLVIVLKQSAPFAIQANARDALDTLQETWLQAVCDTADGETKLVAQQLLGALYLHQRRLPEAEALFTALPEIGLTARDILPTLRMLQGQYQEATRLGQQKLLTDIGSTVNALVTLTSLALKEDDLQAAQRYADVATALVSLFSLENVYRMSSAQVQLLTAHASGNTEAQLTALESYADALEDTPRAIVFDSPYFDHLTPNSPSPIFAAQDRPLRSMAADDLAQSDAYLPLHGNPRFEAILARLRA